MTTPTSADRIWYTVLELLAVRESVTVTDVVDALDDPPARETVYRRLEAMCGLGKESLLTKEPGRGATPTEYLPSDEARGWDNDIPLTHDERYHLRFCNVGGREPDGTPSAIGVWTFQTKLVRDVVERCIEGKVLNACSGKTHLAHDGEVVRNDLNPEREADFHHDVADIDQLFEPGSFDSVVFDPPFDQSQADEHYDGMHARTRGPAQHKLARLVRGGGIFVELGWNDHGPALFSDRWTREECHCYRRSPTHQPVFLTVDRKNIGQETVTRTAERESAHQ